MTQNKKHDWPKTIMGVSLAGMALCTVAMGKVAFDLKNANQQEKERINALPELTQENHTQFETLKEAWCNSQRNKNIPVMLEGQEWRLDCTEQSRPEA